MKISWQEGKYFDLWILVHFLAGLFIGSLSYFLHLSTLSSYIIATVLIVGWEVFEAVFHIKEHNENRGVDIAVGLAGFLVGFYVLNILNADLYIKQILVIEGALLALLEFMGWLNYRKYGRGV